MSDDIATRPTRARMIEATAGLLQQRGYYGTSLNDILAASGAPRGSLYFHFPGGKNQIVVEATRRSIDEATRDIAAILESAENPARGVRSVVEAAGRIMRDTGYTYGCPVAPLVLDSPEAHPELAKLCREAFDTWVGLFRGAFVGAGIDHSRAHALALLVDSAIEGLLLIARAYRDEAALMAVAVELERAVEAALPAPEEGGE